ncbi:ABC transporter permease [Orenia metallireducens]|uniref:ABC transporter permease n=1 Tax=Orenia metallireducens TaxID=1413210 RepID=A0A1C0ADI3_9FIRM|nr:sugar ABC transporter permease [Orenia metallireducens]OCL28750.1 ABC transporter permease [Orenia metallireducens]
MKGKLKKLEPYLFTAPHLIFFIAFLAFPVFFGLYISLHRWELLGWEKPFVGLKNYLQLFNSNTIQYEYFWNAMANTFKFVIFSVPFLVVVGLFLALLVNKVFKGKALFRGIFYTPVILSITSVTLIWKWILDNQSGLANYLITALGFNPIPWLSETKFAWISLVLVTIWWTVGQNMLLFLAGLQDIPQHLYEAAEIDGANTWRKFWHVTLPSLKPTTLFVTVMTTIGSFNIFGQPYMMTKGGPGRATQVAIMYIQEEAFANYRMGSASAMALVMSLFIIIVSMFQFKIMSSDIEY